MDTIEKIGVALDCKPDDTLEFIQNDEMDR